MNLQAPSRISKSNLAVAKRRKKKKKYVEYISMHIENASAQFDLKNGRKKKKRKGLKKKGNLNNIKNKMKDSHTEYLRRVQSNI